jgi:hypothetical protein
MKLVDAFFELVKNEFVDRFTINETNLSYIMFFNAKNRIIDSLTSKIMNSEITYRGDILDVNSVRRNVMNAFNRFMRDDPRFNGGIKPVDLTKWAKDEQSTTLSSLLTVIPPKSEEYAMVINMLKHHQNETSND